MTNWNLFHAPEGEESTHAYHTPLERRVDTILTPFQTYISHQVVASLLLGLATLTALCWASFEPLSASYHAFTKTLIGFHIADITITESLKFFVNDILLTLFFFFVGLEIKREVLVGELTDIKLAAYVIIVALGGMLLPASLYWLVNIGHSTQQGWAIPMATDTAFALGLLACFKQRIPASIFTLLAAIAIVDDIGSIIVIAVYYTEQILFFPLMLAAVLLSVSILMNYAGFRRSWPYLILGTLIWTFIESAGMHGTIAGILLAFVIPARPQKGPKQFIKSVKRLLKRFEWRRQECPLVLEDEKQHEVIEEVLDNCLKASTPLQRWENRLEYPVTLFVLPLFALVNAGIDLDSQLLVAVFHTPVSLGIVLALVLGKPLGIIFSSYLACKTRFASLPKQLTSSDIVSVAFITGIGFTMSIFIANLCFDSNTAELELAKGGILLASFLAAVLFIICVMWNSSVPACKKQS